MSEEAATATEETPEPQTPAPVETSLEDQLAAVQAEAEKWKKASRKNEERAKQNSQAAKELEDSRRQAMTDQELAVAEARDAAIREVRGEMTAGLVAAEFKAAAVAAGLEADALIEALDTSKFLTDDGHVDVDGIGAFVARITPPAPAAPSYGDFGQTVSRENMALNGDPLLNDLKTKLGL